MIKVAEGVPGRDGRPIVMFGSPTDQGRKVGLIRKGVELVRKFHIEYDVELVEEGNKSCIVDVVGYHVYRTVEGPEPVRYWLSNALMVVAPAGKWGVGEEVPVGRYGRVVEIDSST